jgi:DUF218 domain-containing protein
MRQIVAVPGHTIVRTEEGGFKGFIPSPLIQQVVWEDPDKAKGKFVRTGIHCPGLDPNDPDAYLGGGQAVVEAAAVAYREQRNDDMRVVMIGGRAGYLEKLTQDTQVTEGYVMAEAFARETGDRCEAITDTETTEDDVRAILRLAAEADVVTVIMMAFRIPRAAVLLENFVMQNDKEHPEYKVLAIRIAFVPAEQYLPQKRKEFERMTQSNAYRDTLRNERFGMRKILLGSHQIGSGPRDRASSTKA